MLHKSCPNCTRFIEVEVYEEGTTSFQVKCLCGAKAQVVVELSIYVNEIDEPPAKEGDDEESTPTP